jgi:replication factor C small subunit
METFSKHTRFILTCNYVERIVDPIQSRCQPFQIVPPSRKEVASHLYNILHEEEVDFQIDDVGTLVNGGYPDIRRIINFAQRQVVDGKLSIEQDNLVAIDLNINVFCSQLVNVLKTQNKKDAFVTIRKMLADNKITDFADLFRLLYDEVDDYGKGHIAESILTIAKYQLSDAQVVDKEINSMAMLTELLGVIK